MEYQSISLDRLSDTRNTLKFAEVLNVYALIATYDVWHFFFMPGRWKEGMLNETKQHIARDTRIVEDIMQGTLNPTSTNTAATEIIPTSETPSGLKVKTAGEEAPIAANKMEAMETEI